MDKLEDDETKLLILKDNTNKVAENSSTEATKIKYFSWHRLPVAVYFIIITEFCERFTYYGMRSILILFLTQHLLLKEWNAVPIYHFFACLCYLTTIFGCIIADNFFGKYKTMLFLGIIYVAGSVLMSITAAMERNLSGALISIILIGFGTGGVKACVAPLGGDQIKIGEKAMLSSFFSMFYFAINLGALLSTIISPILRAKVACNGSDDCYPLAFGVPAILMGAAMLIFIVGRRFYVDVGYKRQIYVRIIGCVVYAFKSWYRERKSSPKKQFLDYASGEYEDSLIKDIRTLSNILILFIPLPIYWALYEQLGSRWTLQATQLDGEITENWIILPDQMFIFNVLLVVIFVVVFDYCVYPLFSRFDEVSRPLRKMTIGISFTFLSFIVAYFLQSHIEGFQPPKLLQTYSRIVLINAQPCNGSLSLSGGRLLYASAYQASFLYLDTLSGITPIQLTISNCNPMVAITSFNSTVTLTPGQMNFLIMELTPTNKITVRVISDSHTPNIKGYPLIRLALSSNLIGSYQFILKHSSNGKAEKQFVVTSNNSGYLSDWNILSTPGRFRWNVMAPQGPTNTSSAWNDVMISSSGNLKASPIKLVTSEVTIFYMTFSNQINSIVTIPLSINIGSRLSILWQLPQYVLMSIGEVLVNIPGLTFSYDQAPLGMKSLVNSMWYLCDAFGNIIVMAVAKMRFFEKQSLEFLTFAILCFLFNIIFAGLAYWYPMVNKETYIDVSQ